jgi:hypothetical protein
MAGVRSIGTARIGPGYPLRGKWEGEMQEFIVVFTVLRLPTPLKMSYEAAKKQAGRTPRSWESYERRETVQLVRQAVSEGRHAYVWVNKCSEGSSPLLVQALSEMLRA